MHANLGNAPSKALTQLSATKESAGLIDLFGLHTLDKGLHHGRRQDFAGALGRGHIHRRSRSGGRFGLHRRWSGLGRGWRGRRLRPGWWGRHARTSAGVTISLHISAVDGREKLRFSGPSGFRICRFVCHSPRLWTSGGDFQWHPRVGTPDIDRFRTPAHDRPDFLLNLSLPLSQP